MYRKNQPTHLLKNYVKAFNYARNKLSCQNCWKIIKAGELVYIAYELPSKQVLCPECRSKLLEAARENKDRMTINALESESVYQKRSYVYKSGTDSDTLEVKHEL